MHQKTSLARIESMEKRYAQILKSMLAIEPRTELYTKILIKIIRKQVMRARIHLSAWAGVFLATGISFIYSYSYVVEEITRSDFYQYLAFFFSDSRVAVTHWKELVLSLGDSAPLFSITMILVVGFVSLGAIKALLRVRDGQKVLYQFT